MDIISSLVSHTNPIMFTFPEADRLTAGQESALFIFQIQ